MNLPTAPVPATQTHAPSSLLIYGPPKVGKTAILSALPGNLILDLEQGSGYVTALKLGINSLAELVEFDKANTAAKHPYAYVSIDPIDKLEEWCEGYATVSYKMSPQGKNFQGASVLELPNGGGYLWLRNAFYKFFVMCKSFAPRVIFVGHIRDKVLDVAGKEVTSKDLDLTGKIRNIVCSYVDSIGHIYRDPSGTLKVSFETKETVMCGSRCEHLKNKTFPFSYPEAKPSDWKQIYTDLSI